MLLIHCFLVLFKFLKFLKHFSAVKFFLKNIVYLKNSGVTVKDHPLMNELVKNV